MLSTLQIPTWRIYPRPAITMSLGQETVE